MSNSIFTQVDRTVLGADKKVISPNEIKKSDDYKNIAKIYDTHIHTINSNEGNYKQTVQELLDNVQRFATKLNTTAVISITDHQSILGCAEADKILKENPNVYSNIKFISGIEINTDLSELNQDGDQGKFKNCHILGYDYDVNNAELLSFSKLCHQTKDIGNDCQLGMTAVAFRNQIKEMGYVVPFEKIYEIYNNCNDADSLKKGLLSYCLEKFGQENKFDFTSIADKYITDKVSKKTRDKIFSATKLKMSEVANIITNAGGKIVIAHPVFIFKDYQKDEIKMHKKDMLNQLIERTESLTNTKIFGMEVFNQDQCTDGRFDQYLDLCKKHDLFVFAGSDSHGYEVNQDRREYKKEKTFRQISKYFDSAIVPLLNKSPIPQNMITNLSFDEYLENNNKNVDKQGFDIINIFKGCLSKEEISMAMDRGYNTLQEARIAEKSLKESFDKNNLNNNEIINQLSESVISY